MAFLQRALLPLVCISCLWNRALAGKAQVLLYRHSELDRVAARSARNVAYYGKFELGSPPTTYTGCFDTGSADTWVPLVVCTNPGCMTHNRFDPQQSSSFEAHNMPFQITYGTGRVAGFVGSDTVTLGSNPAVQVQRQGFGGVFDSSMDFLSASCDGLFGLAFPELSEMSVNPAFFNMIKQNVLDDNMFGIWMSPNPQLEPAGSITFGYLDNTRYTGSVAYTPVTEKAYWTVALNGVNIGSRGVSIGATGAIMDSGTTATLVSDADAHAIHSAIPGVEYNSQGGYYNITSGCDSVNSLPDISFKLGDGIYNIPARLWTQQVPNSDGESYSCISGIIPGGDASQIILGDNFLRAWYTVYKYDTSTKNAYVGFARSVDAAAPTDSDWSHS